jgi:hypothetical protein
MRAVFMADNAETDSHYSISEWWLEPNTKGPGVHAHPEDHVFYVIRLNVPGGFELSMPHIVQWFAANPLGDACISRIAEQ